MITAKDPLTKGAKAHTASETLDQVSRANKNACNALVARRQSTDVELAAKRWFIVLQ